MIPQIIPAHLIQIIPTHLIDSFDGHWQALNLFELNITNGFFLVSFALGFLSSARSFFLNYECANQIVFYFLFFLSNLCVGMWWAGVDIWVFSGVLCFGVSVFYKICFWMMILQIKFFFLTYVLGCDGLVWILAPRDIDNV